MKRNSLLCLACCGLFCAGQVQAVAQPQPAAAALSADEIRAAARQLGDNDFRLRQKASDVLWQAGSAAEAVLREALKSNDPEVRFRAAAVLDKIRFGIRPDTEPGILLLIEQFRHGNSASAKRQALLELQAKGQWNIILALVRGEENQQRRRDLATTVAGEAGKLVRPLLEKGEVDQALEVLELTAVHEPGVTQLTAALLLTGRLDRSIEQLRARLTDSSQPEDWRRLSLFLRAKGELPDAIAAAEKASDPFLVVNLLAEAREWRRAAPLIENLPKPQSTAQLDHLAYAATFYKLAGDQPEHQRVLSSLEKAAGLKTESGEPAAAFPTDGVQVAKSWFLLEALLVTEQTDAALAILRQTHPQHAHAFLWRQHRHREALELVGVTPDKPLDRAWFDALPAAPGDVRSQTALRFLLASQVARELRELGRPEQATSIVATLRALAMTDNEQGRRWTQVAQLNWQLGRFDEAFRDAAQALTAKAAPPIVFGSLLKQQGQLATIWYEILTGRDPLLDRQKAVEQAVWLSVANPPPEKLPANWQEIVQREAAAAKLLQQPLAFQRLMTLADTAIVRGDKEAARQYLREAVQLPAEADPLGSSGATPSVANQKLGDLSAGEGDWSTAAACYQQAVKSAPSDALPLFLAGVALAKDSRAEEGQKLTRLAELIALAPEARLALAAGLQERGHREQAAVQFDLVRRTASPDSSQVATAAQQFGNLINAKEPLRAAECWEMLLLHVLNANSGFVEVEGYLTLPHVIHKVRAKAALEQQKADELRAELAACERLLPGDVRFVVDFVPKLDKARQAEAANMLFEQAFRVHKQVCDDFPQSATYFNNTAWLAARSQRRLDEALTLSQKAVELAPSESAFLDTLAEVHFQRGDREAAVAAASQALALVPSNVLFQRRLKHFEQDELKTLDGTEADE